MLLTVILLLILLAAFIIWMQWQNWHHPYIQPAQPLGLRAQYAFAHHVVRTTLTRPRDRWVAGLSGGSWLLGAVLLIISGIIVETKLALLIFPTGAALTSVILLLIGLPLIQVAALVYPGYVYRQLQAAPNHSAWTLAENKTLKRYRRHQVLSSLALALAILIIWIARAVSISTIPALVLEYLLLTTALAIPTIALCTALIQIPYLLANRWLTATKAHRGTVGYQADRALRQQVPALKQPLRLVYASRIVALAFGLAAFWVVYRNLWAPAFSADYSAVIPAAIDALIALILVALIARSWPTRRYQALQQLPHLEQLPLTIADEAQFKRYQYHANCARFSVGLLWILGWLAAVASYYYFY